MSVVPESPSNATVVGLILDGISQHIYREFDSDHKIGFHPI